MSLSTSEREPVSRSESGGSGQGVAKLLGLESRERVRRRRDRAVSLSTSERELVSRSESGGSGQGVAKLLGLESWERVRRRRDRGTVGFTTL